MKNVTRRRFLGLSGAATAGLVFPTIIPSSVLGRNGQTPPSGKVTLGCIGVGGMGTNNMRNFMTLGNCKVLAVCDPYEDRQVKAKQLVDDQYSNQDCSMYSDFRDVLARDDIDAVMIGTQDHWHALIATAAARAGKDMYCEKPMGVSVEEGLVIRNAVRRHDRIFQSGTWQRSRPQFRQACELALNGYLGKVHTVEVSAPGPQYVPKYDGPMNPQPVPAGFDWTTWQGPAPDRPYNPGLVAWPDWYLIWDYCAGFVCNWGVHHLDIANWGCPRVGNQSFEVTCKADYREQGFTNNINGWDATFQFADGLKMRFTDQNLLPVGCRFIGDEGWVQADRRGKRIWGEPESLLSIPRESMDNPLPVSKSHPENFVEGVLNRKDPLSDVDTTLVASNLGLIADLAARLDRKLFWDADKETFPGDEAATQMMVRPMHNGWKLVS